MAGDSKLLQECSSENNILVLGGQTCRTEPGERFCSFLYKLREKTNREAIACDPYAIVMENTAAKLNTSLKFSPRAYYRKFILQELEMQPRGFAMKPNTYIEAKDSDRTFETILIPSLTGSEIHNVIYCVPSVKHEGFSFKFWSLPFDGASWILISVTCLTMSVLLQGQWTEVVAIFMRQSCSILLSQKLLILVIFMSIVLTCCYESVISSLIMIPPPRVVFETFLDLLLNGYKYLDPVNMKNPPAWMYSSLHRGNLTWDQIRTLVQNDAEWAVIDPLASCNLTTEVLAKQKDMDLITLNDYFAQAGAGVRCLAAKEDITGFPFIDYFGGLVQDEMWRTQRNLLESGIIGFYRDISGFLGSPNVLHQIAKQEYQESQPVPFEIMNWKILSIFIAWGALLALALVTITSEIIYNGRHEIRSYLIRVCRQGRSQLNRIGAWLKQKRWRWRPQKRNLRCTQ